MHTGHPDIAASGDNVYITWEWEPYQNYDIYLRRSTDGGASFGNIINISNDKEDSMHPKVDVNGTNVYLVWDKATYVNNDTNNGYDQVFFTRGTDGGTSFSNATKIGTDKINGINVAYPSMEVYNDKIFVIWINGMEDNVADVILASIVTSDQNNDNSNMLGLSVSSLLTANDQSVTTTANSPVPITLGGSSQILMLI